MDAWIKIVVVLIMLSMLSWVVTIVFINPLFGLIIMAVIVTMLVAVVEPATGKAMAQITVPLILILFVFQLILNPMTFNIWQLLLTGIILYLLFAVFTGGGSGIEAGMIDPSISLKLFPLYGIVFIVASIVDPTYKTTIIIMVGTVFCLMLLYAAFLRNYDKWPLHEYGKSRDIVAITDINPKGKVRAGAEIWWAKTTGPPIKTGEKVEAVAISGLTLLVAKQGTYTSSDSAN